MSKMNSLWLSVLTLCHLAAGLSSDSEPSFAKALTYGEIRFWHLQASQRPVLASSSFRFGSFPLKVRVQRPVQVHNPTASPLLVQLYLLPSDMEGILRHGCNHTQTQVAAFDLDADECENCHAPALMRCPSDPEEVEIVRNLSTAVLPPAAPDLSALDKLAAQVRSSKQESTSFRMDTLPRYKHTGRGEWVLQSQEVNAGLLQRSTQGFYLSEKAKKAVFIPPGGKEIVGSVYFEGSSIGEYRGQLLIRTNANLYEAIELHAEAKYARLAFRRELSSSHSRSKSRFSFTDLASLDISLTEDDLRRQIDPVTERLPVRSQVTKYFQAENVGNTELRIAKVLLNGYSCELMGIRVENCEQSYVVKPGGTMEVAISYELAFEPKQLQAYLWVFTEEDGFYIPIKLTIDIENWGKYAQLQLFDRKSTSYFLAELFTLLDYIFSIGYLIVVFREILGKQEIMRFRLASTRNRTQRDLYHFNVNIKAPVFVRKLVPEPEEPETIVHSQPILPENIPILPENSPVSPEKQIISPENQPKSAEFRPKKYKKTKASIFKFAPQQTNSPKSEQSDSPAVIATNRLLLGKKKPSLSMTSEALGEMCSEKPGGRELCESTSTHSEEGEDEGEYLDDYKVRQGLFSGFSLRTS